MPYVDTINLLDNDYGLVSSPKNLRSIRFKEGTFKNITGFWTKFRAERLSRKIEKEVENFKNMELSVNDVKPRVGQESIGEAKVMKKAKAIARLEEKLNILYGIPVNPNYVETRAIKLKDNMMKNVRYNSNNAYSLPDDKKDEIFTTTDTVEKKLETENNTDFADKKVDKILSEEEQKRALEAKKIINDRKQEEENVRDDVIVVPEREVKESVDKEFARQEAAYNQQQAEQELSRSDVQEAVDDNFDEIAKENASDQNNSNDNNNNSEIDREDIKRAVDEAINDIKVSKNSSSAARVEKYVNPKDGTYVRDDGTYRLRREDIDEDFRITKIDDVKVDIPRINPDEIFSNIPEDADKVVENEEVSEQSAVAEEQIEPVAEETVDAPLDEDMQASGVEEEQSEEQVEDIVEEPEEDVSMHFNYDEDSVKNLTEAIDKVESKDDIQALLERVKKLKEKQDESKKLAMEAKERRKESEKLKVDALERLHAYEDALKDDLGFNQRVAEEDMKKAQSNEDLVDMMLSMIQPAADPDSVKVEKGR